MDVSVFPYGPSPSKFDSIIQSLVSSGARKVTPDRLEQAGVPRTQVSVALSGLRQLGFIEDEDRLSRLCRAYLTPESKPAACARILKNTYGPLLEVVKSAPSAAEAACSAYLRQLGKGDSAQDKILKLFWFFQAGSKLEDDPATVATDQQPSELTERSMLESTASPEVFVEADPPHSVPIGVERNADAAAIELAHSLVRFCNSREALIQDKASALASLQKEITVLQDELRRARETLSQHLGTYPALSTIVNVSTGDKHS